MSFYFAFAIRKPNIVGKYFVITKTNVEMLLVFVLVLPYLHYTYVSLDIIFKCNLEKVMHRKMF